MLKYAHHVIIAKYRLRNMTIADIKIQVHFCINFSGFINKKSDSIHHRLLILFTILFPGLSQLLTESQ